MKTKIYLLAAVAVMAVMTACTTHIPEQNSITVHCPGTTLMVKGYNQDKADGDYVEFTETVSDERYHSVVGKVQQYIHETNFVREYNFWIKRTEGDAPYAVLYFSVVNINEKQYFVKDLVAHDKETSDMNGNLPVSFETVLDSVWSQQPDAMMWFNDDLEHQVLGFLSSSRIYNHHPSITIDFD